MLCVCIKNHVSLCRYYAGLSYGDTANVSSSSNKDTEDETLQNPAIYPLYVAKRDIRPYEIDMLNFKEGDLFFVMESKENQCYVKAKHSGETGYVPRSCLEICVSLFSYG